MLLLCQFTFAQNRPKSDIREALRPLHYITLRAFAMSLGDGTKCKTCFGGPRMILHAHSHFILSDFHCTNSRSRPLQRKSFQKNTFYVAFDQNFCTLDKYILVQRSAMDCWIAATMCSDNPVSPSQYNSLNQFQVLTQLSNWAQSKQLPLTPTRHCFN